MECNQTVNETTLRCSVFLYGSAISNVRGAAAADIITTTIRVDLLP